VPAANCRTTTSLLLGMPGFLQVFQCSMSVSCHCHRQLLLFGQRAEESDFFLHLLAGSTGCCSSPTAPALSSLHRAASATPVIGPLTSGSRTSFRKGVRNSSGCTADQSAMSTSSSNQQMHQHADPTSRSTMHMELSNAVILLAHICDIRMCVARGMMKWCWHKLLGL